MKKTAAALLLLQAALHGAVVYPERFGAVPGDGRDDTAAVQKAADYCSAHPGSVLAFRRKGRYDFFAGKNPKRKTTSILFRQARNLGVKGNGATLVFHGLTRALVFEECAGVVVVDLTIDWERPPFSVGKLLRNEGRVVDVELLPGFDLEGGEPVEAFMEYDPETRRPLRRGADVYHAVERTELAGERLFRMHLKRPVRLQAGSLLVLRHQVYIYNALSFGKCRNVRVERVTVHAAPGMGLHAHHTGNVLLRRFRVLPRPGRIMSTTADATHFNSCRGRIEIRDCVFEGMGDDAVNVHGMYHKVVERAGARTVLTRCRNGWIMEPAVGDRMEFTDFRTLLPYWTDVLAAVEIDRAAKLHRLTFRRPLPVALKAGDVLGNVEWAPRLLITGSTVRANRARGFLVQTRDALIEGNTFEYVSGAALHITCDADYWTESIGTRKVRVRRNVIRGVNYGAAMGPAAIRVFADIKGGKPAACGAHRDITIEENTIEDTDNAAIFLGSTDGALVRKNLIRNPCRDPNRPEGRAAIFLLNCRNVKVEENTVTGGPDMEDLVRLGAGCEEKTIRLRDNRRGG